MKEKKVKYNKYEKALIFNFDVAKSIFVSILLMNLFLPLFMPFHLGVSSLFQWVAVIVHFYGLLNGLGYFSHRIPILDITIVRVAEMIWYLITPWKELNWWTFGSVVLLDVAFLWFLISDKSNYKYIRVKVD